MSSTTAEPPSRVQVDPGATSPRRPGLDLLRFRPIRAVLESRFFPYLPQAVLLGFFVFLAILGWNRYAPEGVASKLYAKTNLVNLLVWGVWWPAMIWTAVWFGRVWCAVCPLELVSNLAERLARVLGIRQRTLGRWLRSGVVILFAYATVHMLIAGVSLHRVPAYTSILLWVLLGVAALTGLVYRDRAFCRAFCPVGLLLSIYGRGGVLAVRSREREACRSCGGKECVHPQRRDLPDARSCPSLLNPARLESNCDCLLCAQCIKACGSKQGLGFYLRKPYDAADRRVPMASWSVTLFVMLLSGFIAYELCSEWKPAKAVFLWVPAHVAAWLGVMDHYGWVKGVWRILVFPAALWLVLGLLMRLFGGARSLAGSWRRLALPIAVIVAAGHMAKALAKITTWGSHLPYALRDPIGGSGAAAIASGAADKPSAMLPMAVVSAISVVLVGWSIRLSLRESRLSEPATHRERLAAILPMGFAFLLVVLGWGYLG